MTQKDREMEFWLRIYEGAMAVSNSCGNAKNTANEALDHFRGAFPSTRPLMMPEARGPDGPLVDYSKVIGGRGQTTPYLACRSNT
jgi:hypothetical protein